MKKNNAEKGSKEVKTKPGGKTKSKFVVIGGMWPHRKNGSGVEFWKIQIMVNNRQINLTAWPNKRRNHPDAPSHLVYVPELAE